MLHPMFSTPLAPQVAAAAALSLIQAIRRTDDPVEAAALAKLVEALTAHAVGKH